MTYNITLSSKRTKDRIQNICIALVSIALMLVISEILLAYFFKTNLLPYRLRLKDPYLTTESYLKYGEYIPFETKKNYKGSFINGAKITTDKYGFRNTGVPIRDRIDILCMGDSFTFGYMLDDKETYPYFLQKLLVNTNKDIVVGNGGYTGSFSFDGAYLKFSKDLYKFKPRVLIYGLFPGNDYFEIFDNLWTKVDEKGYPTNIVESKHLYTKRLYKVPVLRESRLFMRIGYLVLKYFSPVNVKYTEKENWERIDLIIKAFRESTDSHKTKLIFAFLNDPTDHLINSFAKTFKRKPSELLAEFNAMNRKLKKILNKHNVEYWDNIVLLENLKQNFHAKKIPKLVPALSDCRDILNKILERYNWHEQALAAEDSIHYSALTNIYLAQWMYQNLKSKSLKIF